MKFYCAECGDIDYTYRARSSSEAESMALSQGWTYLGELVDVCEVTEVEMAYLERMGETLH